MLPGLGNPLPGIGETLQAASCLSTTTRYLRGFAVSFVDTAGILLLYRRYPFLIPPVSLFDTVGIVV